MWNSCSDDVKNCQIIERFKQNFKEDFMYWVMWFHFWLVALKVLHFILSYNGQEECSIWSNFQHFDFNTLFVGCSPFCYFSLKWKYIKKSKKSCYVSWIKAGATTARSYSMCNRTCRRFSCSFFFSIIAFLKIKIFLPYYLTNIF